jgi:hypothetical protein
MSQQVTLRVRPGEKVRFPARCVVCERPATERQTLTKRRGQVLRRLDVPLCIDCARQWTRRSGEEERLRRAAQLGAAAVALLLFALAAVGLAGLSAWWLRLLVAAGIGLVGAWPVWQGLRRRAEAAALPETRAVREVARIADFTWRDLTLAFASEPIAAEVRAMNEHGPDDGCDPPANVDEAS